jgi:4-hydroxy-tetrahydrodipicolinate synthase
MLSQHNRAAMGAEAVPNLGPPNASLNGIQSVLCTPFTEDYAVDYPAFERLIEHQINWGVDGLVLFGLAGEGYTLSDSERRKLTSRAVSTAAGRVPVIVSTEHNSAHGAAERTREAAELGASAVMAYPPSFVKPDDASIIGYYEALSGCGLSVVIQDAPAWTGISLPVELLTRIATAAPRAAWVKVEAPPIAPKLAALVAQGIAVISGYGALHLLEDVAAGASAVMPGCGMPGLYRDIWAAHARADVDTMWCLYAQALPALVFQMSSLDVFVAVQKRQLQQVDILTSTVQRAPTKPMTADQLAWFDALIARGDLARYISAHPS